jgi:molecular chaperone HscB
VTALENPFETLGLEPSFGLDLAALERRQRELSRALHPDRYAGRPAGERRQALSRAMDVNHAFRTLRDPVSRADSLLALLAAPPAANERATDPGLLMNMMEQREELDRVRNKRDQRGLLALKETMAAREQAVLADLDKAFGPLLAELRADATTGAQGDARFSRVRPLLTELRYVRRFLEEVRLSEDEGF